MELWQIAAALGVHDPESDDAPRPGQAPALRSRRDLVAERMRAARGEGPPPQPDEPDASVGDFATMFGQFGGQVIGG